MHWSSGMKCLKSSLLPYSAGTDSSPPTGLMCTLSWSRDGHVLFKKHLYLVPFGGNLNQNLQCCLDGRPHRTFSTVLLWNEHWGCIDPHTGCDPRHPQALFLLLVLVTYNNEFCNGIEQNYCPPLLIVHKVLVSMMVYSVI